MLTTVEKIIILQDVDVFEQLTTEDLAHIAAISEEITVTKNTMIYKEGGFPNSMYLLMVGKVRLLQGEKELMVAGNKDTFGIWALFDDQPRMVTAIALEDCHLLRIDKDDFIDVLAENVRITQGILKALVRRVRGLMTRVSRKPA